MSGFGVAYMSGFRVAKRVAIVIAASEPQSDPRSRVKPGMTGLQGQESLRIPSLVKPAMTRKQKERISATS